MGDHQTPNIFQSKNLFSVANPTQKNSLISTVPLFSKSTKNGGDIVKMWLRHRYTRENDPLKCHNSGENAARRRKLANPPATSSVYCVWRAAAARLWPLRDTGRSTHCGLRWAAVFTLVTCSTKSYVVRMLKLLVAHFTAILVCCAKTLAASTRPFLRIRYRFRRSILNKGVINSGSFGPIVSALTGAEEDNICWTIVTKS